MEIKFSQIKCLLTRLGLKQILNYLVISWYGVKGSLTWCWGQTFSTLKDERVEVDIQDYCLWLPLVPFAQQSCVPRAIQQNPLTQINLSSYRHILLPYACKLLLMRFEPSVMLPSEWICGQEMNHFSLLALMLFGFLMGGGGGSKSSYYLSNLSWEDLIRIYLLVWLGSGFTVVVVLISLSLTDITSCLAILVLINWYSGCLLVFLCANRVTVMVF